MRYLFPSSCFFRSGGWPSKTNLAQKNTEFACYYFNERTKREKQVE